MDRRNFLIDDIYALQVMQHLFDGPYLPFTNSALRPLCLAYMLNDIVVNSRKTILEFGSGISTIMMSRLIKINNTGTRLISVEHDRNWANVVQAYLQAEGLEEIASILYAPLTHCPIAIGPNLWYELDANAGVIENASFDMVVVDGPPAYELSKEMSRYPALPFIYNKLSDKCSVFLDDADRWGEKAIISRWESEYGMHFHVIAESFAYILRGESFNLNLF